MEATNKHFLKEYGERIAQRLARQIEAAIESGCEIQKVSSTIYYIDGLLVQIPETIGGDYERDGYVGFYIDCPPLKALREDNLKEQLEKTKEKLAALEAKLKEQEDKQ